VSNAENPKRSERRVGDRGQWASEVGREGNRSVLSDPRFSLDGPGEKKNCEAVKKRNKARRQESQASLWQARPALFKPALPSASTDSESTFNAVIAVQPGPPVS
jgi:hypothetical protein